MCAGWGDGRCRSVRGGGVNLPLRRNGIVIAEPNGEWTEFSIEFGCFVVEFHTPGKPLIEKWGSFQLTPESAAALRDLFGGYVVLCEQKGMKE